MRPGNSSGGPEKREKGLAQVPAGFRMKGRKKKKN